MHLLREGQFGVATTFVAEANANPPQPEPTPGTPNPQLSEAWENELAKGTFNSRQLQQQFADMYSILRALKEDRDLRPAIRWARENGATLEARGSNLEFELCKLQFVCMFLGRPGPDSMDIEDTNSSEGPLRAWAYARSAAGPFQARYAKELQQLAGSLVYWPNLQDSPYKRIFYNESAWEEVAASFTREFCSLLGLSADSPLYSAATAGAIALPILLKLQTIMKEKRTEWTTQDELPVSIRLNLSASTHVVLRCSLVIAGRNPPPACIPLPLHFRMSSEQGASNRRESAHDDAVRACYLQGEPGQSQ